jgi:DnaK suppressor protein
MTEPEKKELISLIHSEIEKLKARLKDIRQFTAPVEPDCAIGRVSRMDAINNKSVFEASERNIKARLSQLEQTLKMTNDKDFGLCIKCRQSISFERLRLKPEIRVCASCMGR